MAQYNPRITGQTIVKRVLSTIGLPVPTSASGATDVLSIQIWGLLTEIGQELLLKHEWQLRTKTWVLNTIPGTLSYDLPVDFERFIDSTDWNMTARIPLIGPMTAQQWALLQARQLGGTTLRMQYRINNNQIQFYFVPSTAQVINLQYMSRGWVQDATNPLIFKDTMEADGDICLYDPRLIVAMLKFRFRRAKGFNTVDLEQEYEDALEAAKNSDTPGADLSLSQGNGVVPYLGYFNMPDTGYGGS